MEKKKTKSSFKILSAVFILFVVLVFVGFLFVFTNEFKTGIKTFYVKCDEDTILTDREDYTFEFDKTYRFDIKYPLNVATKEQGYFVSVTPNISQETMFDFSVDNAVYGFSYESTLGKGFDIKTYENYFTFKVSQDLQGILSSLYEGQVVSGNIPSAVDSDLAYFKLNIFSADKKQIIKITFKVINGKL